jgi:hypothetical protein
MKVVVLTHERMGDLLIDDMAYYRNIGVEICNDR